MIIEFPDRTVPGRADGLDYPLPKDIHAMVIRSCEQAIAALELYDSIDPVGCARDQYHLAIKHINESLDFIVDDFQDEYGGAQ